MSNEHTIGELVKTLPPGALVEITLTVPRDGEQYGRRLELRPENAETAEAALRRLLTIRHGDFRSGENEGKR